jgi:hypothetical protein
MSDNCDPIRLPIQIETSCGKKNTCDCNSSSDGTACTLNATYSSQNTYHSECNTEVKERPSIAIAFLSNVRSECQPDLSISLNSTELLWCDFLTLFYRANNVFSINPTNGDFCAINFSTQTYENTTSKQLKLNIAQQIRTAWANKCETSVDNIPPKTNILLNKDAFGVKSLLNASSLVALTLDQAIETLMVNGEIAPGDSNDSASVNFIVQYKYCFKPLNTCVLINFVFSTDIPCYKNLNFCDDWCPIYSNDKNCRGGCPPPDSTNEAKDIITYLNKNFKNVNDNASVADDTSELNDNESVTNLNKNDNNTIITAESSQW